MAATPEEKGSSMISMVVDRWKDGQTEQFSPIHHINGFPWRLRVYNKPSPCHRIASLRPSLRCLSLICDKSHESELWECTALVEVYRRAYHPSRHFYSYSINHNFTSWDEAGQEKRLVPGTAISLNGGTELEVRISSIENGAMYRIRPSLNPTKKLDGILVIGAEKKKIQVNKRNLSTHSPIFAILFNVQFKGKAEIPIHGVGYEEFANILDIFYDSDGASLTEENVCRMLELAERFQFKIVEERIVNFLLSNESFTMPKVLLIAEQFNLTFPMDHFLKCCTKEKISDLVYSLEFDQLSRETLKEVFNKGITLHSFKKRLPKVRSTTDEVTDPAPVEPCDGIIVFGEENKQIHVNKKSLATLSPFFDRLFFGNFKEKDLNEISIGDCEYEEFTIIMAILYGSDCSSLNGQNIRRILELSDRFDLKIIEDKIVSVLLSSSTCLSIHQKLQLITDYENFSQLMKDVLAQFHSVEDLKSLSDSPEWANLSTETIQVLFEKFCI